MADSDAVARVLSYPDSLLTRAGVARIEQELARDTKASARIALDCRALSAVRADGLAALLELGAIARATRKPLALVGLSRALTRTAIEAELAAHFDIYLTAEAFTRSEPACAP